MTKGDKQSFKDFTNQKQLRLTEDPNYPAQNLAGDASTDNRQFITEPAENTMAMQALQANSGMFMHPMHDVTQTEQVHGDKVLEQLQTDLAKLEAGMEEGQGEIDSHEAQQE